MPLGVATPDEAAQGSERSETEAVDRVDETVVEEGDVKAAFFQGARDSLVVAG